MKALIIVMTILLASLSYAQESSRGGNGTTSGSGSGSGLGNTSYEEIVDYIDSIPHLDTSSGDCMDNFFINNYETVCTLLWQLHIGQPISKEKIQFRNKCCR